jgi:hypothetical protein
VAVRLAVESQRDRRREPGDGISAANSTNESGLAGPLANDRRVAPVPTKPMARASDGTIIHEASTLATTIQTAGIDRYLTSSSDICSIRSRKSAGS